MFTQNKLAKCPNYFYSNVKVYNGFTLIEMMVVLVLMGLVASVAMPNFERWFSSTQQRVDASRIAMQVQNLLSRATILNQSIEISALNLRQILADGKPALNLPAGWVLQSQDTLSVYGSGYCVPSEVTFISTANQKVSIQVIDQTCNVGFTLRGKNLQ